MPISEKERKKERKRKNVSLSLAYLTPLLFLSFFLSISFFFSSHFSLSLSHFLSLSFFLFFSVLSQASSVIWNVVASFAAFSLLSSSPFLFSLFSCRSISDNPMNFSRVSQKTFFSPFVFLPFHRNFFLPFSCYRITKASFFLSYSAVLLNFFSSLSSRSHIFHVLPQMRKFFIFSPRFFALLGKADFFSFELLLLLFPKNLIISLILHFLLHILEAKSWLQSQR